MARRCHNCGREMDASAAPAAPCPRCGATPLAADTRVVLIPESYGPGEIGFAAREEHPMLPGAPTPPTVRVPGPPTPATVRTPGANTPPTVRALDAKPVDPRADTVAFGGAAVVPSDLHFPPVTRIAHYDILGEIARGGMGVVYRARDSKLNRLVALKVLLEGQHASEESIERFLREARSNARLRHPNIVPIYDMGVFEGRNYLVMEYVVGQPLSNLVRSRDLSPARAVDLLVQVAEAVEHAHREGIVHRDIKPGNILVDTEWRAKVTDFGLAKAKKGGGGDLTKSGTAMGTPFYMPPEQARGDTRQVDTRSDIYSMGAVLYECLCGRPPFVGENDIDTILKVVNEDAKRPREYGADVPEELEHVCLKALEKDPAARYQGAREFADDLRRFRSGEGVLAKGSTPVMRLVRAARRHRQLLAAGFVGFAVAAVMFGAMRVGGRLRERRRTSESTPVIARGRLEVPLWEARDVSWTGEGWKLGTAGGEETWEADAPAERRLVASGVPDGALRLEFRVDFDKDDAADLAVRLCGHPDRPEEGYHVRVRRSGDRVSIDATRAGAIPRDARARVTAAEGPLPVAIEHRVDGLFVWAGGGAEPALRLFDPAPALPRENREAWISASRGALRLVSLTLLGESADYRRHAISTGDRFFQLQAWDVARERYRFAAPDMPSASIEWEALYRAALCDLQEAESTGNAAGYQLAADGLARVLREAKDRVAWWAAQDALAVAAARLDKATAYADLLPDRQVIAIGPTSAGAVYGENRDRAAESQASALLKTMVLGEAGLAEEDPAAYAEGMRRELLSCHSKPDLHCAFGLASIAERFYRERLWPQAESTYRELLAMADALEAAQKEKGLTDPSGNKKRPEEKEIREISRRLGNPAIVLWIRRVARERLARAQAAAGRPAEAIALLDAWIDAEAKTWSESLSARAPLLMVRADIQRAAGETDAACETYCVLVAAENDIYAVPATIELVRTLAAAGLIDRAFEELDEAEDLRPLFGQVFQFERGLIEVSRGAFPAARGYFEKAAAGRAEGESQTWHGQAAQYVLGRLPRAAVEPLLGQARGTHAHLEWLTGVALELSGKPKEAASAYRRAEGVSPAQESPWFVARARAVALKSAPR